MPQIVKVLKAFPKQEITHTNENLKIADDAMSGYEPVQKHDVPQAEIVALADVKIAKRGQKEITADYKKCCEILADIEAGKNVDEKLSQWAERYQHSIDFKAEKKMDEWFNTANGN